MMQQCYKAQNIIKSETVNKHHYDVRALKGVKNGVLTVLYKHLLIPFFTFNK